MARYKARYAQETRVVDTETGEVLFFQKLPIPEKRYKHCKKFMKYFLDQPDLRLTGTQYRVLHHLMSTLQENNLCITAMQASKNLKMQYSGCKKACRELQRRNILLVCDNKRYLNPRMAWYSRKGVPVPDESHFPEIITEKLPKPAARKDKPPVPNENTGSIRNKLDIPQLQAMQPKPKITQSDPRWWNQPYRQKFGRRAQGG
jgi:hypothetical protein